jgi:hypothetical protein
MNSRVVYAALSLMAFALPARLEAHPGHGVTDPDSLAHQALEWVHAGPWWIIAATAALAAAALWRAARPGTPR